MSAHACVWYSVMTLRVSNIAVESLHGALQTLTVDEFQQIAAKRGVPKQGMLSACLVRSSA